jgi:hypothetical protein
MPVAVTATVTVSPALTWRPPAGSLNVIFAGPEGWMTEMVTVFVVGVTVLPEAPFIVNRYMPGFFPAVGQRTSQILGAEGVVPSFFINDAFSSSSAPVAWFFTVTFTPEKPLDLTVT